MGMALYLQCAKAIRYLLPYVYEREKQLNLDYELEKTKGSLADQEKIDKYLRCTNSVEYARTILGKINVRHKEGETT